MTFGVQFWEGDAAAMWQLEKISVSLGARDITPRREEDGLLRRQGPLHEEWDGGEWVPGTGDAEEVELAASGPHQRARGGSRALGRLPCDSGSLCCRGPAEERWAAQRKAAFGRGWAVSSFIPGGIGTRQEVSPGTYWGPGLRERSV